jgi:hypothetical protein
MLYQDRPVCLRLLVVFIKFGRNEFSVEWEIEDAVEVGADFVVS